MGVIRWVRVRDPWSGRAVDAVYVVGDDRDGTPNLPPVIDSVAIDVAPGGEAKLRLDATDPEGGGSKSLFLGRFTIQCARARGRL